MLQIMVAAADNGEYSECLILTTRHMSGLSELAGWQRVVGEPQGSVQISS